MKLVFLEHHLNHNVGGLVMDGPEAWSYIRQAGVGVIHSGQTWVKTMSELMKGTQSVDISKKCIRIYDRLNIGGDEWQSPRRHHDLKLGKLEEWCSHSWNDEKVW